MINYAEEIKINGFVIIPSKNENSDIVSLANSLGSTLTPWKDKTVQTLVPKACGTPNSYSGMYGHSRFPFHTDLAHWKIPPRYILLQSIRGYADVPTLLVDGQSLVRSVSTDIMLRAIFRPRRPIGGRLHLLHLLEDAQWCHRIRWDEVFLRPASKVGRVADTLIREWLSKAEPISIALVCPGTSLLIDNWRMLHARSRIPPGREDRRIERIYLEALH